MRRAETMRSATRYTQTSSWRTHPTLAQQRSYNWRWLAAPITSSKELRKKQIYLVFDVMSVDDVDIGLEYRACLRVPSTTTRGQYRVRFRYWHRIGRNPSLINVFRFVLYVYGWCLLHLNSPLWDNKLPWTSDLDCDWIMIVMQHRIG